MEVNFEQFVRFCDNHLGDKKGLLKLVKKRFDDCDPEYKCSTLFLDLLHKTAARILEDETNFFVHLRDFLNTLKDNKYEEPLFETINESSKRPLSDDDSEEQTTKRARAGSSDSEQDGEEVKYDGDTEEKLDKVENADSSKLKESSQDDYLSADEKDSSNFERGNEPESEDQQDSDGAWENEADAIKSRITDMDLDLPNEISEVESVHSPENQQSDDPSAGKNEDVSENVIVNKEDILEEISKHDESLEAIDESEPGSEKEDFVEAKEGIVSDVDELESDVQDTGEDNDDKISSDELNNKQSEKTHELDHSITIIPSDDSNDCQYICKSDDNNEQDVKDIWHEKTICYKQNSEPASKKQDKEMDRNSSDDSGSETKKQSSTSSDEDDPFYKEKARKARERLKKKYVLSVGKKNKARTSLADKFSKDKPETKHSASPKTSPKDKSPGRGRKRKTSGSHRSPVRKQSPGKSPIVIMMTDSESESDIDLSIEKFDELRVKKGSLNTWEVRKKVKKKENSYTSPVKTELQQVSIKIERSPKLDYIAKKEFSDSDSVSHFAPELCKNFSKFTKTETITGIRSDGELNKDAYSEENNDVDMVGSINGVKSNKESNEVNIRDKKRVPLITQEYYTKDRKVSKYAEDDPSVGNSWGKSINDSDRRVFNGVSDDDEDFEKIESGKKSGTTRDKHGHCSEKQGTSKDKPRTSGEKKGSSKDKRDQQGSSKDKRDRDETRAMKHGTSSDNPGDRKDKSGTHKDDQGTDDTQKKGSNRQIKKLEKLMEQIRDQIEKVRTRELDLNDLDSEVSDYMLEDKLQRKFVKVWEKLCKLHKATTMTGRPSERYFKYEGTRYPQVNRKIERFINRMKIFPDFHDIHNLIQKVNKDEGLHLRSREIDDLAREAFTDVGNQLQQRRQKDFIATLDTTVNLHSTYDDPALYDPDLKRRLEHNKKAAKNKMDMVVEKYASLQYKVGDKTDDEDDEEEEEEEEKQAAEEAEFDQLLTSTVLNSNSEEEEEIDLDNKPVPPVIEIETVEEGQWKTFDMHVKEKEKKSEDENTARKEEISDQKEKHFLDILNLFGVKERSSSASGQKTPEVTNVISIETDDEEEREEEKVEKTNKVDTVNKSVAKDIVELSAKPSLDSESQTSIMILTDNEDEEEKEGTEELFKIQVSSPRHISSQDHEILGVCSLLGGNSSPDLKGQSPSAAAKSVEKNGTDVMINLEGASTQGKSLAVTPVSNSSSLNAASDSKEGLGTIAAFSASETDLLHAEQMEISPEINKKATEVKDNTDNVVEDVLISSAEHEIEIIDLSEDSKEFVEQNFNVKETSYHKQPEKSLKRSNHSYHKIGKHQHFQEPTSRNQGSKCTTKPKFEWKVDKVCFLEDENQFKPVIQSSTKNSFFLEHLERERKSKKSSVPKNSRLSSNHTKIKDRSSLIKLPKVNHEDSLEIICIDADNTLPDTHKSQGQTMNSSMNKVLTQEQTGDKNMEKTGTYVQDKKGDQEIEIITLDDEMAHQDEANKEPKPVIDRCVSEKNNDDIRKENESNANVKIANDSQISMDSEHEKEGDTREDINSEELAEEGAEAPRKSENLRSVDECDEEGDETRKESVENTKMAPAQGELKESENTHPGEIDCEDGDNDDCGDGDDDDCEDGADDCEDVEFDELEEGCKVKRKDFDHLKSTDRESKESSPEIFYATKVDVSFSTIDDIEEEDIDIEEYDEEDENEEGEANVCEGPLSNLYNQESQSTDCSSNVLETTDGWESVASQELASLETVHCDNIENISQNTEGSSEEGYNNDTLVESQMSDTEHKEVNQEPPDLAFKTVQEKSEDCNSNEEVADEINVSTHKINESLDLNKDDVIENDNKCNIPELSNNDVIENDGECDGQDFDEDYMIEKKPESDSQDNSESDSQDFGKGDVIENNSESDSQDLSKEGVIENSSESNYQDLGKDGVIEKDSGSTSAINEDEKSDSVEVEESDSVVESERIVCESVCDSLNESDEFRRESCSETTRDRINTDKSDCPETETNVDGEHSEHDKLRASIAEVESDSETSDKTSKDNTTDSVDCQTSVDNLDDSTTTSAHTQGTFETTAETQLGDTEETSELLESSGDLSDNNLSSDSCHGNSDGTDTSGISKHFPNNYLKVKNKVKNPEVKKKLQVLEDAILKKLKSKHTENWSANADQLDAIKSYIEPETCSSITGSTSLHEPVIILSDSD